MRKMISISAFLALLIAFSGCGITETKDIPVTQNIDAISKSESAAELEESQIEPMGEFPADEITSIENAISYGEDIDISSISLGEIFNDYSQAESGKLEISVNDVILSKNVKDLGINPSDLDPYSVVSVYDGTYYKSWQYPHYLSLETGELASGLNFVLVNISVRNVDAISKKTASGRFPDGFESQYIFMANKFYLVDLYQKDIYESDPLNTYFVKGEHVWFSLHDQRQESRNAYELLPGESIDYQIGYIINLADGHNDSLYLSTAYTIDAPDATWIKLDFS